MTDIIDFDQLKNQLRQFSKVREWDGFHTPKNLSMAVAAESGELLEIFQWLNEEESRISPKDDRIKAKTSHEIADIMLYLVRLADAMDINLNDAIQNKIQHNNQKYPADLVKGSVKKYDEYFTD